MPKIQELRVRDKKTGLERTVTPKAFELLKKRYVLLDQPVPNLKSSAPTELKKSEKVAQPVVAEVKIPRTAEEIQAKKAELSAMNQAAIESAVPEEGIKVRQKPGPKPKVK